MGRIDDLVRLENMILQAEEGGNQLDREELGQIIQRLNQQSGPYGHKRKQLIDNLFKTIYENALPGFIEYLFYGYDEREKESNFFCN